MKFNVKSLFWFHRFMEGLKTLNVLEAMQQHPEVFMDQFFFAEKKITAEAVEATVYLQCSSVTTAATNMP